MIMIRDELFKMQDKEYRDFQAKLIPGKTVDVMIGVRTPDLRKYAKELVKKKEYESFLKNLPHDYFDEDQLHAFIISELKDYDECIEYVKAFLPYVDNWATCDQMSPKVFKKNKEKLLEEIKVWIKSDKTYTIRFGIGMLMQYFLDEDFKKEYLKWVSEIKSEEYYVNMMIAWYFATALAKQYESTISYIEKQKLDKWTHNKTIQKSVESYRITDDQKKYLRSLKVK
ncbi:MAG: DNA alkylation repair protein [Clostridia bacterium]|nr:DNA alkylation repair protein [Bacilli bacterium]MBR3511582.1 DNA alkylation repair protein [Clostridia bacterium]